MSLASDLKAWHRSLTLTRAQAAAALGVPVSTYDGWCAGRPCVLEGAIRRLMAMLSAAPPESWPSAPDPAVQSPSENLARTG